MTPSREANRQSISHWLDILGNLLQARYRSIKAPEDLDRAIAAFQRSAATPHGSILASFHAARHWAELARSVPHFTPSSCIQAYSEAIALLPQLSWLGQSASVRQELLTRVDPNIVGDAAACAIELGDLPMAIELLEQGRSIFWAQLLQFRMELTHLQAVDSSLAD